MAECKTFENVEIEGLYKKVGTTLGNYLLKLRTQNKKSMFSEYHEINIQSTKLEKELNELKDEKLNICYFAFGMQDIDIYKSNNGKYGITHSPHEGLNIRFILADNEFEKLINNINFTIKF